MFSLQDSYQPQQRWQNTPEQKKKKNNECEIYHIPQWSYSGYMVYLTHWIAVSNSLDLIIVFTSSEPGQTVWVELATRRVQLLPVIHTQLSTK